MNNSDYAHLHLHTDYSLKDGAQRVVDVVNRVHELGMRGVALTDHGTMGGTVNFYKKCQSIKKENGEQAIKPILGMEGYICNDMHATKENRISKKDRGTRHIVLLAKNNIGYKNIMTLSSMAYKDGFYYDPRFDFDALEKHKEGIVVLGACMKGVLQQHLLNGNTQELYSRTKWFKDLFGDDFYLEVMYHGIPEQQTIIKGFKDLSKKFNIKILATNDAHYINQTHENFHKCKVAMYRNTMFTPVTEEERRKYGTGYYIKSASEMLRIFGDDNSSFLTDTIEVVDKCNVNIEFGQNLLPMFDVPDNYKNFESYYTSKGRYRPRNRVFLEYLCAEGVKKRGLHKNSEYINRLKYELDIVLSTEFVDYFLIVWDFVNFARNKNIKIGPGRGSGCGSLMLYCLYITNVDPIPHDLPFWRFLSIDKFVSVRKEDFIDYKLQKENEDARCKV